MNIPSHLSVKDLGIWALSVTLQGCRLYARERGAVEHWTDLTWAPDAWADWVKFIDANRANASFEAAYCVMQGGDQ